MVSRTVWSSVTRTPGACLFHSQETLTPKPKRLPEGHTLREYEGGILGILGRFKSERDPYALSPPRELQRSQSQSSRPSSSSASSPKSTAITKPTASPVANTSARSQGNRTRPIENSPQEGAPQMVLSIRPKQNNNTSTRAKIESSSSKKRLRKNSATPDSPSSDDTRGGKRRHSHRPE
ncbi:hypothetical protein PNOK_0776900 [Pyrrhoderma noxium]|uniref:Uncharacterized protein n=1 Tax=Pyrrhoderma noxium TaxID=2282107 RepID=A0A286U9C2_9AGAM|nr:hypothetical protein PNOK_0776900 [Pyrrhoderma noxium]